MHNYIRQAIQPRLKATFHLQIPRVVTSIINYNRPMWKFSLYMKCRVTGKGVGVACYEKKEAKQERKHRLSIFISATNTVPIFGVDTVHPRVVQIQAIEGR